jgi:uncharacterized protein (DUF58 family)
MFSPYGALLDALRGTSWPARRLARGTSSGTHRSRLRGTSPEFTEYRPYRQGDDPRRLDWKLLARTDRTYVRLSDDRATFATMLLVDGSASMAFPRETAAKWEMACQIAVGLAAVARAAGDPVGIVVAAPGGTKLLAPRTRRDVIAEIARLLAGIKPDGVVPLGPALDLIPALHRVAIVSDFLGELDAVPLVRAARDRLALGGEIHAVHIIAPEELDPAGDAVLAIDPENSRVRRPLTEGTREEYLSAFSGWRRELGAAWRAAGASYVEVTTDEAPAHAVRRIIAPAATGTGKERGG